MNVEAPVADKADTRSGKYLTFRLGNEEFGIQVLRVREIIGMQEVTPVPQAPAYVKGVINLRGKVIPVVDLRLKFGMEERRGAGACMIVVQVDQDGIAAQTSVVVDGVSEVVTVQCADIEDTPDFGRGVSTSGLLGIAKIKGRVTILLDVNMAMGSRGTQNRASTPG